MSSIVVAMSDDLRPWEKVIWAHPRTGEESIGRTGKTLLDFWRWAHSDLMVNAARGALAEYLVATAVGDGAAVRDGWATHNVTMPPGDGHPAIRVEVRHGGYLQTWRQPAYTKIHFGRLRSWGWNRETGRVDIPPGFHADVYVFAVHTCREPEQLDILDLAQWDFRVLHRRTIEEYGTKSLAWGTVQRLAPKAVAWEGLKAAVREAYEARRPE
jgi:hypothetical protein